ncbi:MAG: D-alanine--D-alanine ligase family protein [Streptosporangiaceae bacterium]
MTEQRKIRVAVVFGGRGPEHQVSCMGGGNMLAGIDRSRYEVIPVGITTEGNWVLVADDPERLAVTSGQLPTVAAVAEPGSAVVPWSGGGPVLTSTVATAPAQIPHLFGDVDVVLPVLHGPYGEDGTIQGLLELAGVRYVGAGVLASAVSMDKEYMNLIFRSKGLPVGPFVVVRERDWPEVASEALSVEAKRVLDDIEELGWPLFVKPARGGSSIGTSKAHTMDELRAAIATARQYDPKVLVEAAIDGVEVEVSVLEGLDGAPPDTSVPGQLLIDGGEEFWDFEAKYLDAASSMAIPAPLPDSATTEIRRLAAAAFDAVSCEGLARVDFFYTRGGEILVNEINTMPGLSPASYFQKMWEASGMPFAQLIDRLLQTALKKRPGLR